MPLAIYPPVGIARVGNSQSAFYIGPEIPGHPGVDVSSNGVETTIARYKATDTEVKRQAARFRIFDVPASGEPKPVALPAGATIEWMVHLVNKKGAVQRPGGPPTVPRRPTLDPTLADRLIDPGSKSISGAGSAGVTFDQGTFMGRRVPLGELRTDRQQHLLVLGGVGFSSSPTNAPITGFYTNAGWHDDVSDGPVTARIRMPDGTVNADIAPAWVVVTTPDYAPEIAGVVTLYDILCQVGIDHFGIVPPAQVSFTRDVFPLLHRTRRLRWVNQDPNWSDISDDWATLADASAAHASLRSAQADVVRNIESVLSRYRLTARQQSVLSKWVAGAFVSDWVGIPAPGPSVTASGMTRAALDSTVGQGFFPGIEAGIILKDPTLYRTPFDYRLNPTQVAAGDLTAFMAMPWQADFRDCVGNWWPSQRPDDVLPAADATQTLSWDRGAADYLRMVNNFAKLGVITAQKNAAGDIVFAESQRAPSAQFG